MRALLTCAAVMACGLTWPGLVHAEDTAAACRNAVDDDRDGLVDCADPSCSLFVFCAPAAGPTVTSAERAEGPEPEPVFALTVNVGGAATFGPSLGVELRKVSTTLRQVRYEFSERCSPAMPWASRVG